VSANEIGNPAFNGDIAINGPRGGYLIGFEDLLDPAYADVARGYRNYIRVLAALKEIRDGLTVNNLTPIISAGLNTPGDAPEGTKLNLMEDEVSLKGVLLFLHANGLDDRNNPPSVSTLDAAHQRATNALASVASRK
jgi:hypothetical protein